MIQKLEDLDLKGKRVFVRVDFNVPLKTSSDGSRVVADATRIEGALDTIRHVLRSEGKCILCSHLGRPEGKVNSKYSLEPVGLKLSELLGSEVILTDDCVGDGPRSLARQMRGGDILLLENVRFHTGEEQNSVEFANQLLELCDVYVSDAFGTLHRAHASTSTLPRIAGSRCAGFLVQRELEYLTPLRDEPDRPFVLVMGGSKVSDKIGVLEHFLPKMDKAIIGGAMAYAFLKAKGVVIGNSFCDEKQVALATKILKGAEARRVEMVLPVDHLVSRGLKETAGAHSTEGVSISDGWMGVDIGPKSLELFGKAIQGAKTIFWNGPMGVFEEPAFSKGTFELARVLAAAPAVKIAGGGDSAAALEQSGVAAQFSFISTGGGATLEFLEGKKLPGIEALE